MNWTLTGIIVYLLITIAVCLRIVYDTRTTVKTLAYLLLVVFIPIFGIYFYFSFGVNYRKRKLYSKKLVEDENLLQKIKDNIFSSSEEMIHSTPELHGNRELVRLLVNDTMSPLSRGNRVKLLLNGENKFPEVLEALRNAKHHIHIEYYIFDDDKIGNQIKEILMQKAREGVQVRFIYDHFGSRAIEKRVVPEMQQAGVEAYPFYKTIFILMANRYNYRNHRKIIVIDGVTGFLGGINVSDRYINNGKTELFWRDTHVRIDGPGVYYLQYIFMCDWNFCVEKKLLPDRSYFDTPAAVSTGVATQIAASGPDSDTPSILFSLLQAINLAQKEVLIATPYFIPGESMMDALSIASLSGVSVKLLLPGISDSKFIDLAGRSYYEDLLNAGVEIYLYRKGFMHAKVLVTDSRVSVIGSANMDFRSLELNFEANAIIYDQDFSTQLRDVFYEDLSHAVKIDAEAWRKRPWRIELAEKLARLTSPLL